MIDSSLEILDLYKTFLNLMNTHSECALNEAPLK